MSLALAELCDQENNVRESTNSDKNNYLNNYNQNKLFKNDIENLNIEKSEYKDINTFQNEVKYDNLKGIDDIQNIPLNFNANDEYEEKILGNKKNIFSESYINSMKNIDKNELKNIFEIQNKSNINVKIDNKASTLKSEENNAKNTVRTDVVRTNTSDSLKKNEKNENNFSVSEVVAKVLANLKAKNVDDNDKKYRGQRRKFLDEETERVSRIMLGKMAKSNR
jgi:hypothetical protein